MKQNDTTIKKQFDNVDVNVKFYWDSHGTLVPFPNGPDDLTFLDAKNVSIKILEKELVLMGTKYTLSQLEVDGTLLEGDLVECQYTGNTNLLNAKVVVGWG